MNNGERDELKAKLSLIFWRDHNLNDISLRKIHEIVKEIEQVERARSEQKLVLSIGIFVVVIILLLVLI